MRLHQEVVMNYKQSLRARLRTRGTGWNETTAEAERKARDAAQKKV